MASCGNIHPIRHVQSLAMAQYNTFFTTFTGDEIASEIEIPSFPGTITKDIPNLTVQHEELLADVQPGIFKQICRVFPTEKDVDRLVAVTVALSYACRYDDELETLGFAEKDNFITKLLAVFDHEATDIAVDEPQACRIALQLTFDIIKKLRILLPNHAEHIIRLLRDVVVCFRSEINFQRTDSHDLDVYRQIRNVTIGVTPLIAILAAGRVSNISSQVQRSLIKLEQSVTSMCGLQNDLLGLHRDLQNDDLMSFPVIHARSIGAHKLDISVVAGIQEHNDIGREAARHYMDIMANGNEAVQIYAHKLFYLPTLSFQYWARGSRYQPKVTTSPAIDQFTSQVYVPPVQTLGKVAAA